MSSDQNPAYLLQKRGVYPPETNIDIAPENQWLEDEFPFGMAYFQVLC